MLVCNRAVITTGDCESHSELPKVSFTQANINTYLGHSNNDLKNLWVLLEQHILFAVSEHHVNIKKGYNSTFWKICLFTLLHGVSQERSCKKVTASIMTENRIDASLAVSKQ